MIKGDSIFIRVLEPDDVNFVLKLENNPEFWQVSETLFPYSRFEIEAFVLNSDHDIFSQRQLRFIICKKESKMPLGIIDLFEYHPLHRRVGVGIVILESEQGQGYAKEALKLVEEYAFKTLSIHQIFCNIQSNNSKSIALFTSIGYSQNGIKKDWEIIDNQYYDVFFFQKIREF